MNTASPNTWAVALVLGTTVSIRPCKWDLRGQAMTLREVPREKRFRQGRNLRGRWKGTPLKNSFFRFRLSVTQPRKTCFFLWRHVREYAPYIYCFPPNLAKFGYCSRIRLLKQLAPKQTDTVLNNNDAVVPRGSSCRSSDSIIYLMSAAEMLHFIWPSSQWQLC